MSHPPIDPCLNATLTAALRWGIDPRMDSDLSDVLGFARAAAEWANALVRLAWLVNTRPVIGHDLTPAFDLFFGPLYCLGSKEWAVHAALADLVPAARPGATFGASCAHLAALEMRERVLTAAEVFRWNPRVFRCDVPRGLPDARAIVAACEGEAYRAFERRHAAPVVTVRQGKGVSAERRKGKHIDARMLKVLAENPESYGWSCYQWADHLGCTASTVVGTATWKERLAAFRAAMRLETAQRQARRGA